MKKLFPTVFAATAIAFLTLVSGCSGADSEENLPSSVPVKEQISAWLEENGYAEGVTVSMQDDKSSGVTLVALSEIEENVCLDDKLFPHTRALIIQDACWRAMGALSRFMGETVDDSEQTDDDGVVLSRIVSKSENVISSVGGLALFEAYDSQSKQYAVCVVVCYNSQTAAMIQNKRTDQVGEESILALLSKVATNDLLLPRFYVDNAGSLWIAGASADPDGAKQIVTACRKSNVSTKNVIVKAKKDGKIVRAKCKDHEFNFAEPIVDVKSESVTDVRKSQKVGLAGECDYFIYAEKLF